MGKGLGSYFSSRHANIYHNILPAIYLHNYKLPAAGQKRVSFKVNRP